MGLSTEKVHASYFKKQYAGLGFLGCGLVSPRVSGGIVGGRPMP